MRVHKSGQVWLDLHHADALAETIPALPTPRKPDPAAVVAGRIEAGQPWLIRLRDTHLFIAGATGPGTALLWAIVRGLANGIRCRTVSLSGIGRRRFERLAHEDTASMLALLENAVAVMRGAATPASRAVADCANRIVECPGRAYQGRVHAHAADRACHWDCRRRGNTRWQVWPISPACRGSA